MATEHKRMRQLQATDAEWQLTDPTLLDGEAAFSSDTKRFKVGPGLWSTLDYWIGQPPENGLNYGEKDGVYTPTVTYVDEYVGDLDNVPDDNVSYLRLAPPIQNGWVGAGTMNEYLLHMADDASDAIQVGYAWTPGDSRAPVVRTRLRRSGSWTSWTSSPSSAEDEYNGSLDALAIGEGRYVYWASMGPGFSGGWPGSATNDTVLTVNVDASTARQVAYAYTDQATSLGVWLRSKTGGVWSEWATHKNLEADIIDLDRVRWRGVWLGGTYEKNDMVTDGNWLTIANKQTTDRAAPQEDDNPAWTLPDVPLWSYNQHTGVVESGMEVDVTEPVTIIGYEVWAPSVGPDIDFVIRTYAYPTGQPDKIQYEEITNPILAADDWTTIAVTRTLLTEGTTVGLRLATLNSGSDITVGPFNWVRGANSNGGAPATGEWNRRNQNDVVRIAFTDDDGIDRSSDMAGVIAGSMITIANQSDATESVTYRTTSNESANGASYEWTTVLDDTGTSGEPAAGTLCAITLTVPVPAPTDYVQVIDGFLTQDGIKGYLSLGGVEQAVENDGFGVRMLYDTWTVSPDWDIASMGSSSSGDAGLRREIDDLKTQIAIIQATIE